MTPRFQVAAMILLCDIATAIGLINDISKHLYESSPIPNEFKRLATEVDMLSSSLEHVREAVEETGLPDSETWQLQEIISACRDYLG